jgi:hypothetical protein
VRASTPAECGHSPWDEEADDIDFQQDGDEGDAREPEDANQQFNGEDEDE